MGAKITKKIAKGVYRLKSGSIRAKVAIGDRRRGVQREKTFPRDTSLLAVREWQTSTRAEINRQRLVPARGTVEADIPRYLSDVQSRLQFPDNRKYEIEAWLPTFKHRRRHAITTKEISGQVKDWLKAGVAASTVRRRLSALSMMYEELDGADSYNPVRAVLRPSEPEPQPEERPVHTIQEVLDDLWWRAAMNNRGWKTLARAAVLVHTGIRHSQLKRLDPDLHVHLDRSEPSVDVPSGKGGKAHQRALGENGVAAFRLFLRVNAHGEFSNSSLYKSWILACKRAGVKPFNPYKLRHSYASRVRRAGTDLADVQDLLGHRSAKTTQRYAAVSAPKLVAAVQRAEQVWNDESRGQTAWADVKSPEDKASNQ